MSQPSDPLRLAHDPDASDALRRQLRVVQNAQPSEEQVQALESRLAVLINTIPGTHLPVPKPIAPPTVVATSPVAKILVAVTLAGVASSGGYYALHHQVDHAPPSIPVATQPAVVLDTPHPQEPALTAPPVASEPPTPTVEQPARSTKTFDSRGEEAALLQRAKDTLEANPERALAMTQEHSRRFPSGSLVQEREVIAITALERMGRLDQARQRAIAFHQRFPDSGYWRRLNHLTDDAKH